jgi:hypothetical protein
MFHIVVIILAFPSLTLPHPIPAAKPYQWPAGPIPNHFIVRPATPEEMHAILRVDTWGETSEYLRPQVDEDAPQAEVTMPMAGDDP